MRLNMRWTAAVGAAVLLTGCAQLLIERGFPEYSGIKQEAGLLAQVQIYRDHFGIPHIYADNEQDLFFAQGYVHAQDRLWQMETFRRLVRGRTAEVGGEEYVNVDMFMRMLRAEEIAERLSFMISPETERILDAYVQGVNAFMSSHKKNLPLEFESLGLFPEPYSRKDAFSSIILISWFLNQNYSEELLAVKALSKIPLEELAGLFPSYPVDWLHTKDNYLHELRTWNISPFIPAAYAFKNLFQSLGGSNNWAVSGEHMESGKPMLANDPHLVHTVPSFWYFNHLNAPGIHVAGASIAGAPGVAIGHTENAAWAITNLMADYVDLCVVEIDPEDPFRYFWKGESFEMEKEEILLPVRDADPRPLTIYRTEAGPVLTQPGKGEAQVVLKWLGKVEDRTMDAFIRMNRADTAAEIMEAGRLMGLVSINLVAADNDGNIAWHATGRVPVRNGYSGFWPVGGNRNKDLWTGFIPYDELPSAFNPPDGIIVTANEKRVGDDYPYSISYSWGAPYRARRIRQLLENNSLLSEADFKKIQNDVYSLRAETLIFQIRNLRPRSEAGRWALQTMLDWDKDVNADSLGAAVYEVFITKIIENFLKDDLGEDLYYYFDNIYKPCILDNLPQMLDSPLWDRRDTPKRENYADILDMSLSGAVEQLTEQLGEEREEWTWGRLYKIYYRHPGAQSWFTRELLNIGPFPKDGDSTTVNVGGYNPFYGRFYATVIPSMRMIVNLGDTTRSHVIGSMGQSGQPQHPHYGDMIDFWRTGKYAPFHFSLQEVESRRASLLVMRPQRH
ncbi:MAG: penicillin acylase family protein [Candidatus Aminicenantes bacterium]